MLRGLVGSGRGRSQTVVAHINRHTGQVAGQQHFVDASSSLAARQRNGVAAGTQRIYNGLRGLSIAKINPQKTAAGFGIINGNRALVVNLRVDAVAGVRWRPHTHPKRVLARLRNSDGAGTLTLVAR